MRGPGVASAEDRFKARSETFIRMAEAEQRPLRLRWGEVWNKITRERERCGELSCSSVIM